MWEERVVSKLLFDVISIIEHDGKAVIKNPKIVNPESWGDWVFFPLSKLLKHLDADTVWMVTTAYAKGALYSIAIILFIMIIYLIKNSTHWRRARVFVSYQHMFEDIATTIVERLKQYHLRPMKLPFLESPEHNSLLDEVKTRITESDLIVCIPGEKPSFVEHEVAMAFALEKPLMFVSTNDYLGRIPNTAKQGYPIINLNSLDEGGWSCFCNFCLYVTGYNMSLINMCLCVMSRFVKILGVFAVVYILVFAAVVILPDRATVSDHTGWIEGAIIISMVILFVIPYLAFTRVRMIVAKKIRQIIGRQSFDLSIAPPTLTYGLRKADVADILFRGNVIVDHDIDKAFAVAKKIGVVPLESDDQGTRKVRAEALGGDPKSQFEWGQLLYSGQGRSGDKAEASAWFRKAAEQGLAEAQYTLGVLFENGDGVEQNNIRAAHWYLQAARQGHALAQNNLGEFYHEGRGVEQDYTVALKWYEAAADQGVASAAYNAGYLYFQGLHVKRDRAKALALFDKSAACCFTLARYALGVMYENGLGVKKDKQKAKKFYELAAADGDADAQKAVERLSKRFWQFWKPAQAAFARPVVDIHLGSNSCAEPGARPLGVKTRNA